MLTAAAGTGFQAHPDVVISHLAVVHSPSPVVLSESPGHVCLCSHQGVRGVTHRKGPRGPAPGEAALLERSRWSPPESWRPLRTCGAWAQGGGAGRRVRRRERSGGTWEGSRRGNRAALEEEGALSIPRAPGRRWPPSPGGEGAQRNHVAR